MRMVTLLLVIAAAGLLVGPARAARTPASPASVAVGFCEQRDLVLLGRWERRSGWQTSLPSGPTSRRRAPRDQSWVLHRLGDPPVTVSTGPLKPYRHRSGGPYYVARISGPADVTKRLADKTWLAVRGGSAPKGAQGVKVLPNDDDVVVAYVRKALGQSGPWRLPGAGIRQNLAVDLNADGRQDRLLTINTGLFGDSNVVIAATAVAGERYSVHVLTRTVERREQYPDQEHVLAATVFAITDVNGDGNREVAVSWGVGDGSGVDIYSLTANGFRSVLHYLDVVA